MSATEAAIPAAVVADPAASGTHPAASAAEATADPIRPTEAEALTAESRPEVTGVAAASAAAAEAPTKESVGEDSAKIEAQPINEGTLAYKGPGLLKNLIYNKKHFFFNEEPLSHENLATYLKNEKDKLVAHHNAAHATETGKGLLFFVKRQEDKDTPEGIINLADAVGVTREPGNKFSFKVHEKTYNFHAPTKAECESWVVSVETAIQDAVANKEVVIGGEKYKLTKEKLTKPVVAGAAGAAAGAAGAAAVANKDKVHDGTPAEATTTTAAAAAPVEEKKEEKKERSQSKGRSNSRKRQSIFGSLLGKKDDKAVEQANEKEAKKEEKAEEKKEEEAAKEVAKEEPKTEAEPAVVAAPAAAAAAAAVAAEEKKTEEPAAPVAEETKEETKEEAKETSPAPKSKRASVFGFFNKKSGDVTTTKDLKKEEAPAVPAKDTPVADSAPQLDPVDTTTASEATPVVAEAEAPAAGPQVGTEEPHKNPIAPLEATPEAKAANKQKEGGDLFSFMKKKKAEHDMQKAEDKTEGAAAAEKTEGTSPTATNEKRRSSFFNSGLFRKSSKSQKPVTGPVTDSSAPPAIPAAEESAAAATTEEAAKADGPVAASTEAAPVTEALAKGELPNATGETTGTDSLPVTAIEAEATPAKAETTV